MKILKKHDKRSSSLSLRSPFLVSVLQQPFYSTEVLSGLIVKVERMFRQLSVMTTAGEAGEPTGAALEPAAVDPTPYTLNHTPYTLHPTPYTLHPKP